MNLLRYRMSLFVSSLNSGSNGNCYYIGNEDEAILIDGGISCRETEKRLKRLGLSIKKVKGIFVSHEHGDHIHGIPAISRKYQLPVYISDRTLQQCNLDLKRELIVPLCAYEAVKVGSISIVAFPTLHDACDPHNFIVASSTVKVGVFTDIGVPCNEVRTYFQQCHAAFLEANYDEDLLNNGGYPLYLKERIRGGRGHLSNKQAMQLFMKYKPSFMSHLFLSHLSQHNNCPTIVEELFSKICGKTEIVVASRHRETRVYHIRNIFSRMARSGKRNFNPQFQLSLFQ